MQKLRGGIEEYIEQHPMASLEDIRTSFGKPSEIAAEYLPDITPKEMKKFSRRKIAIYILVLSLVVFGILFGIIYCLLVEESPGVIKETGKFDSTRQIVSMDNY